MSDKTRRFLDTKVLVGLGIILIGVLLLLENMGYIYNIRFWGLWPIFPILIGVSLVLKPQPYQRLASGWILIIVGALFLGNNLDLINFGFGEIWPLFLVLAGFAIIRHAIRGKSSKEENLDFIDMNFILGGGDYNFTSKKLEGAKFLAFMGGGTIDFRQADMASEKIEIDVFAMWGGIELIVPQTWSVIVQGMPIMGGIENKATVAESGSGKTKTLIITGTVIMGGVEIKN